MFSDDSLSSPQTRLAPSLAQLAAHLHSAHSNLFPVMILPEPCSDVAKAHHRSSVINLMRAVLDDAVFCFNKLEERKDHRSTRLAREAKAWLFSDDERWPFAFVNVCYALGLDPAAVRCSLQTGSDKRPLTVQRAKRVVTHRQKQQHLAA